MPSLFERLSASRKTEAGAVRPLDPNRAIEEVLNLLESDANAAGIRVNTE